MGYELIMHLLTKVSKVTDKRPLATVVEGTVPYNSVWSLPESFYAFYAFGWDCFYYNNTR
jgi:hypothetical protein